jgi:hypothetical protein
VTAHEYFRFVLVEVIPEHDRYEPDALTVRSWLTYCCNGYDPYTVTVIGPTKHVGANVGRPVGAAEGTILGIADGLTLGPTRVTSTLGLAEGDAVGDNVGVAVDAALGTAVRLALGAADGTTLGSTLGMNEGHELGCTLGI